MRIVNYAKDSIDQIINFSSDILEDTLDFIVSPVTNMYINYHFLMEPEFWDKPVIVLLLLILGYMQGESKFFHIQRWWYSG